MTRVCGEIVTGNSRGMKVRIVGTCGIGDWMIEWTDAEEYLPNQPYLVCEVPDGCITDDLLAVVSIKEDPIDKESELSFRLYRCVPANVTGDTRIEKIPFGGMAWCLEESTGVLVDEGGGGSGQIRITPDLPFAYRAALRRWNSSSWNHALEELHRMSGFALKYPGYIWELEPEAGQREFVLLDTLLREREAKECKDKALRLVGDVLGEMLRRREPDTEYPTPLAALLDERGMVKLGAIRVIGELERMVWFVSGATNWALPGLPDNQITSAPPGRRKS